ncbi:MAG TPA: SIMPL domain-containing protein [Candidatus Limnocylindrales bacterium]|nr:SIMPL domain-containing protein [Candidatus Limnocylindrales bacterium]
MATTQRTISVPGEGRVTVRPDLADLRVGISLTEPTVQAARTAGAVALQSILSRLATLGIKDGDIQTSIVSMTPAYDYSDRNPPRLIGYALTNTVSVTIRDLERVGDVIDGALTSGATTMDSLGFRVANPDPHQRAARELAVRNARARAETLAATAGVEVGDVLAISEGGAAPAPFESYPAARQLSMAKDVSTPIEAGMTEVSVDVTVTFAIR